MDGYIKLYRKLLENPIFHNEKLLKVFIWCLLKATYKVREVLIGLRTITLKPGQFIYGRKSASEELKMPESSVRNYMNTLKTLQILDIKTDNKFSIVTIVNWEFYQSDYENMDSVEDLNRTTNGQQMDTNKKEKKVKNILYSSAFEEFWNFYPRKVGKAEAFSQWKKRMKDGVPESDLIKAANNYATECRRKGTESDYIKHPRTFLSSKKPFEDYITAQTVLKPAAQSEYRDLSNYVPGGED